MATVLVTGGAGYIGSHTCVSLLEAGHRVVVVDNLSNSSRVAVERVRALVPDAALEFHDVDLRDVESLDRVFAAERVAAVIHFAGLKAVGESAEIPLRYYDNNVVGTVKLLEVMDAHDVRHLVLSSSATVYAPNDHPPLTEDSPLGAISPYGRTKVQVEEICRDVAAADDRWRIVLLRYFNPVGAHESGSIGEDPDGLPNNLMPFAMQVAVGRLPELPVFGGDYDTPDGTCIRDYIHVVDLADAHLAALDTLDRIDGCTAVNVGTGTGHSVLEVVSAVSEAIGRPLPHRVVERRPGDSSRVWADTTMAHDVLGWQATRSLADMCADHWRWQSRNPAGYAGADG